MQKDETTKSVEKKMSHYWAKASGFQLDNLVPERKSDNGLIIQDAIALIFNEHIWVTDDPKEIKHIEASSAFRAKRIVKCANYNELIARTRMHDDARAGIVKVDNKMETDVYSQHEIEA